MTSYVTTPKDVERLVEGIHIAVSDQNVFMNTDSLLASIETFANRLFELSDGNEGEIVVACPGWKMKDLLAHIGIVYGAVAGVIEEMIDDVVENVMELALSRELTADDVVTAMKSLLNIDVVEIKEQKNG